MIGMMPGVVLIICTFVASAWANDSEFFGAGGDVYPMENNQIEMAKETLEIEGIGPWRFGVTGWRIKVRYEFQNRTDKPVHLQFGFPEHCGNGPEDEFDKTVGFCDKPGISGFSARIDGQLSAVDVKRFKPGVGQALKHRRFGRVHTFKVAFAAKQRRVIEHTYEVGGIRDSSMGSGMDYILETGALWAGPIGTLDIKITWKTKHDGINVFKSGRKALPKPTFQGERNGVYEISWHLTDFEPAGDISIYLMTPLMRQAFQDFTELMTKVELYPVKSLSGQSRTALRRLRNMAHAFQGYTFLNPALKTYFEGMAWYAPRLDFDPKWISKREHAFIAAVKKYERAAKGSQ